MADNVTYPGDPASTRTVWTDEVAGSKHAQYVKLVDGTADSVAVIPGDATYGLDVDVTRLVGGANIPIEFGDGWIVDAFGRVRVSLANKILELKHIYDARPNLTSSVQTSGTGTSATTLTAGTGLTISSGYQQAGTSASTSVLNAASDLWPGIGADGSQDTVVLAVQRLSGTTETFWGSMTLLETV